VSEECDHDRILAMMGSRRTRDRSQAIVDAYLDPHADALLARMLDTTTQGFDRVRIAATLGDLTGEAGGASLRRAIAVTGPGTRDLRCAAVLALAKREGAAATSELRSALANRDGAVRDYAMVGLAGAGDESAWDEVFARLPSLLRRKRRVHWKSEVAMALAYLAQHLNRARHAQLVRFVREHWTAVDEPSWFDEHWPDARPDGPAIDAVSVPDATELRLWARFPLFEPLGAPSV
jgi:hypothetical protein